MASVRVDTSLSPAVRGGSPEGDSSTGVASYNDKSSRSSKMKGAFYGHVMGVYGRDGCTPYRWVSRLQEERVALRLGIGVSF